MYDYGVNWRKFNKGTMIICPGKKTEVKAGFRQSTRLFYLSTSLVLDKNDKGVNEIDICEDDVENWSRPYSPASCLWCLLLSIQDITQFVLQRGRNSGESILRSKMRYADVSIFTNQIQEAFENIINDFASLGIIVKSSIFCVKNIRMDPFHLTMTPIKLLLTAQMAYLICKSCDLDEKQSAKLLPSAALASEIGFGDYVDGLVYGNKIVQNTWRKEIRDRERLVHRIVHSDKKGK